MRILGDLGFGHLSFRNSCNFNVLIIQSLGNMTLAVLVSFGVWDWCCLVPQKHS